MYGIIVAYLLCYNKFGSDIEEICCEFNPYDPCFSNRIVH